MRLRAIATVGSLYLGGCSLTSLSIVPQTGSKEGCPTAIAPPAFEIAQIDDFYKKLQTLAIFPAKPTLAFQTANYRLTYCRATQAWTIEALDFTPPNALPDNYEAAMKQLADPTYQSVQIHGKSYRYRVALEPNPYPDFKVAPKQAVLEVVGEGKTQPQKLVLYTLAEIESKNTGIQMGMPSISQTLLHENQVYWTIAPEQGEGNGGVGTIVRFTPARNILERIQPRGLENQKLMGLAIAGAGKAQTWWIATQISGEGNPYLPGMGLVAYRPATRQIQSFQVGNSPIVGAIPSQLHIEGEDLWVATGNGVCRVQWRIVWQTKAWRCWRFVIAAQFSASLRFFPSLFAAQPIAHSPPLKDVEILWWLPMDTQTRRGRYEVAYPEALTVNLSDQGAIPWSEFSPEPPKLREGDAPLYWAGRDWFWRGDRFVRPLDGVALNYFGGGPNGIGRWHNGSKHPQLDLYAVRGDLQLLKLTRQSTQVKHESAWVDDRQLKPILNLQPVEPPSDMNPNPLTAIARQLFPASSP